MKDEIYDHSGNGAKNDFEDIAIILGENYALYGGEIENADTDKRPEVEGT